MKYGRVSSKGRRSKVSLGENGTAAAAPIDSEDEEYEDVLVEDAINTTESNQTKNDSVPFNYDLRI